MIIFRQVSESETYARQYLPVKNDRYMQKVFGDSKAFPGVVAYLMGLDLSATATKTPYKKLWEKLFTTNYIATRVLSDTARGDCMVRFMLLIFPLTQTSLGLA